LHTAHIHLAGLIVKTVLLVSYSILRTMGDIAHALCRTASSDFLLPFKFEKWTIKQEINVSGG
jgi:hypothetical protein